MRQRELRRVAIGGRLILLRFHPGLVCCGGHRLVEPTAWSAPYPRARFFRVVKLGDP